MLGITGGVLQEALLNISPARCLLQNCLVLPDERDRCALECIERISGNEGYERFFSFMQQNVPVIITGLNENWPCKEEWTHGDGTAKFSAFASRFGNWNVPVAICNSKDFNDQERTTMSMHKFVQQCEGSEEAEKILYLKDWHMVQQFPGFKAYETPLFFMDDWINDFWDNLNFQSRDNKKDDYRFVYIGKKGSFTPLHKDVFRSYSWSTNIAGTKLWTLFPVEETSYLFGGFQNKETVWDIREWEHSEELQRNFPNFHKTRPIKVVQNAGETIFVPSGWYHQVENLEDTISINHNWGNACNLDLFWDFLKSELKEVEHELEDCKEYSDDWAAVCQQLMKANTGINIEEFLEYFEYSTRQQIEKAKILETKISTACTTVDSKIETMMEKNYILFNLQKIKLLSEELEQENRNFLPAALKASIVHLIDRLGNK